VIFCAIRAPAYRRTCPWSSSRCFTADCKARNTKAVAALFGDAKSPHLRPMSEFDPPQPALVHDQLNDETFEGCLAGMVSTTSAMQSSSMTGLSRGTVCYSTAGDR
jgi:hypothetical protein